MHHKLYIFRICSFGVTNICTFFYQLGSKMKSLTEGNFRNWFIQARRESLLVVKLLSEGKIESGSQSVKLAYQSFWVLNLEYLASVQLYLPFQQKQTVFIPELQMCNKIWRTHQCHSMAINVRRPELSSYMLFILYMDYVSKINFLWKCG